MIELGSGEDGKKELPVSTNNSRVCIVQEGTKENGTAVGWRRAVKEIFILFLMKETRACFYVW